MFGIVVFMRLLLIYAMLLEYCMRRVYQFHQTPVLCDHQDLACTPKDPPRRVDMKEISIFLRKLIDLSTKPFENLLLWDRLKTAYELLYVNQMNYMKVLQNARRK